MSENHTLTGVPGILAGHAADARHRTGCTAVLCPEGAAAGVHIAGFAPGTIETALLDPLARVQEIHGLLLTGGSAFGLAAAAGVVRWLAEHDYGIQTLFAKVPLVPGAVIYDLNFNRSLSLPDADMGYRAAAAASDAPLAQGSVGAGTGATCGKVLGFDRAMKSGLGSYLIQREDLAVGALAVVNPVGDVYDPDTGEMIAGVRSEDGRRLVGAPVGLGDLVGLLPPEDASHTVIAIVASNARLGKVQAGRLARMASAGIARAVRPAHLLYDGDAVFALATGRGPEVNENIVGALAAEALARAVAAGAREAESAPGFPAHRDMTAP